MIQIKLMHMTTGGLAALFVLWLACVFPSWANEGPSWWITRGVLSPDIIQNNYAAVNIGQLKHIAFMAWLELGTLEGGAGFEPVFTNAANNYAVLTVGQLVETARPFYDRLGLQGHYPWSNEILSNGYGPANIGQVKRLFSFPASLDFDQDGLPNWYEIANGLDPYDPWDAVVDLDGDGLSNLDEFMLGSNPSSGTISTPASTTISSPVFGNGQTGLLVLTPDAVCN